VLDGEIPPFGDPRPINPLRPTAYEDGIFVTLGCQQSKARSLAFDEAIHCDSGRITNYFDRREEFINL